MSKISIEDLFNKYQHAPDEFRFTRAETSFLVNRDITLLERDAWSGEGPLEFVKVGRRCFYTKKTIREYLSSATPVRSTTQAAQRNVESLKRQARRHRPEKTDVPSGTVAWSALREDEVPSMPSEPTEGGDCS